MARKKKGEESEGELRSTKDELMLALVQKDYVLFAPKSSRGLKSDYPELADAIRHPEFVGISTYDMLFIWAWSCASSPFLSIDDRNVKLDLCCRYAYPKDQVKQRSAEYSVRFPPAISSGIDKMQKFSIEARVQEYVALKQARENYMLIMCQDITRADDEQREAWLKQSLLAQKALAEQRSRVEGLDLGLTEASDTMGAAIDLLALHHQQGLN